MTAPVLRRMSARDIVERASAPLRKGVTVDLTELLVDEPLDLSGATLGNLDFSRSVFRAPVRLRGATFAGLAWFEHCDVGAAFDASDAVFCNDLRLRHSTVRQSIQLSRAEVRGVCSLDRARFEGRADLDAMTVLGNMSLADTVFAAPVTLQDCQLLGGLWCDGAQFLSRADFRGVEVHGRTWLKRTTFTDADRKTAFAGSPERDIQSYGYRWT